jgi:hypothetical protein
VRRLEPGWRGVDARIVPSTTRALPSRTRPEEAPVQEPTQDPSDELDPPVMDLLARHVPLSLLVDIATPTGPDSRRILLQEGTADDPWWEPRG